MLDVLEILEKKKNGKALLKTEIQYFVNGMADGSIPDYQISALAMAICINGMNERETITLTDAMANSGSTIPLEAFGDLSVDKHSTGGVGDKTTLIVAPIVASLGARIGKMSGRGLGHTGGTIDKLESIKGFSTVLPETAFFKQVRDIGIAVIGQSQNSVPADKKLYAIRDVTSTVDNISLIASSIMSKKIAAGAKSIVLDVKVGDGAFMKTYSDAQQLAQLMVKIGVGCGRRVAAVLTDMNNPLGRAVGNRLEILEALSVLKNDCENCKDLKEVSVELAATMLSLALEVSVDEGRTMALRSLERGLALKKFKEWISAQGGETDWIDNPDILEKAPYSRNIITTEDGYISEIKAHIIGEVATRLGAGRLKKDDMIDYTAGIIIEKKPGEEVKAGDVLATLYASDSLKFQQTDQYCKTAFTISSTPVKPKQMILGTVTE